VDRTEIVLAVVRRGDEICLARRSQLVATGRGLWSVITGYLEAGVDPMTQIFSELQEELGLLPPTVTLSAQLPPVPLESSASGKLFLVHPFLFDSATSELVLNWEHDDVQWIEPSQMASTDCVRWQLPLVESLLQTS
jgi:ribose 1,5-bisphosphate isomerase